MNNWGITSGVNSYMHFSFKKHLLCIDLRDRYKEHALLPASSLPSTTLPSQVGRQGWSWELELSQVWQENRYLSRY